MAGSGRTTNETHLEEETCDRGQNRSNEDVFLSSLHRAHFPLETAQTAQKERAAGLRLKLPLCSRTEDQLDTTVSFTTSLT